MFTITTAQINAILSTMENNNIGVKEYIAISKMLQGLPKHEEQQKEKKKEEIKKDNK